ncbi:protein LHCP TRANSLOCATION DEFECT [Physcomitrium patens]
MNKLSWTEARDPLSHEPLSDHNPRILLWSLSPLLSSLSSRLPQPGSQAFSRFERTIILLQGFAVLLDYWIACLLVLRYACLFAKPRSLACSHSIPQCRTATMVALLQASALSVPAAFALAAVSNSASGARPCSSSNNSSLLSGFAGRCVGSSSCSRSLGPQNGSRVSAWFKFGTNGASSKEAGIYGSQKRADYDESDVEQYFNYMGMLATEGTYDKMYALLNQGIPAVDILLMMAANEGDQPKVEELIEAGADGSVKNNEGKSALDLASNEVIRELIAKSVKANA